MIIIPNNIPVYSRSVADIITTVSDTLDWHPLYWYLHVFRHVHVLLCIRPSQEKHANLPMHWMRTHRFSLIATIADLILNETDRDCHQITI